MKNYARLAALMIMLGSSHHAIAQETVDAPEDAALVSPSPSAEETDLSVEPEPVVIVPEEQEEPAAIALQKTPKPAAQSSGTYNSSLINDEVIALIRKKVETDLVVFMLNNQNKKYTSYDDAKIQALDKQWMDERAAETKPLISATLTNPLSSYLTMVQAHSYGLFTTLFVMDDKGLNVGQSDISSDYWQGDEAKWQKTYLVAPDAVFIDDAEQDETNKYWIAQVNLAIADPATGKAIGAVTVDVNLNELKRRRDAGVAIDF